MPVEHIELVHLHEVEVVPDDGLGDVVPRRVYQDTAVGEPGRVQDLGPVNQVLGKRDKSPNSRSPIAMTIWGESSCLATWLAPRLPVVV